jgi:hypothetical protein
MLGERARTHAHTHTSTHADTQTRRHTRTHAQTPQVQDGSAVLRRDTALCCNNETCIATMRQGRFRIREGG